MFEVFKSCAVTCSSHSLLVIAQTSFWIRLFQEVIACEISWGELESLWVINKKVTQFRGLFYLALVFSRNVTHFYGFTLAMTFDFSRISKINPETSVEYLQRHFLNHPACFFSRTDHWCTYRLFILGAEICCPLHWYRTSSWTSRK